MTNALDNLYWQHVKAGTRTFSGLTASRQTTVKILADAELEAGLISQENYNKYLGAEE